ncbi:DivIVA domain-containing protein [Microbacterium deminutum]
MSDQPIPARNAGAEGVSPFDELIGAGQPVPANVLPTASDTSFTTAFRGYDKDEVDTAIARLTARLRADGDKILFLERRYRRVSEAADSHSRDAVERLGAEFDAKFEAAQARSQETIEKLKSDLAAANARAAKAGQQVQVQVAAADAKSREDIQRLEAELAAANARAGAAEQRVQTLGEQLVDGTSEATSRPQFEEILRVAEDQASLIIRNASVQADRLLEAAREEIMNRRKEVQTEAESILSQAQVDAQQARLRIETEVTAHEARVEREAAHAAEKVSQAEQEAAAIRTEAEKGAAALRSMVARETSLSRAEAEEAVRELRVRALEFEESLTRRQDDAQQEFLLLHNQAVAHAERITQDANDQVAASLEHAQRLGAKADDFDRLMRAQAQQVEADASVRAREILDRARAKAQKIIDTVTVHSQGVLRDAEDRTRQLRWQQHQLTSFMAEVKELIRPETSLAASDDESAADAAEPADAAEQTDAAEPGEFAEQTDAAESDAAGDAALLEDETPVEHVLHTEDVDAAHDEHEDSEQIEPVES